MRAALTLFAEKGLHNATVSEIAARAEVSQGTVYWYFDSKEELFEAAFVGGLEAMLQPLMSVLNDAARPARERLLLSAEMSIDVFADSPELAFLMLQIMSTQGVAEVIAHDFGEYYEEFGNIVAPLFDEIGDPDPTATAAIFIGLLDGLMLQRLVAGARFDREAVVEQVKAKFNLEEV
jgi:AcrR family transcriptional regulator